MSLEIINDLNQEIDRLTTALDAAMLDTARLNYLERHPKLAEMHVKGEVTACYYYAVAGAAGIKLREIMDSAMKADPT